MRQFLIQRTLLLLLTLLAASAVVFAALEVLPGNAAQVLLGPDADAQAVAAKAAQLGLDQPAPRRYGQWLAGLLRGDMGVSYAYGTPVADLVWERLHVTVPLAVLAMALAVPLALCAGVHAASRHGRAGDWGVMALVQAGMAIPSFWLAMLLVLLFSVRLQWLAAGGFDGWHFDDGVLRGLWAGVRALLLPAVALALVQAAILARFVRAAVLDAMGQDFVRTARAKGLSARATLWRHVLRNALVPVITVMGLQFAELLAGTVVVESVFQLPGLGRLVFQSIANRDVVVVRNCVLLLAAMVVCTNFAVDVLHAWADPRMKDARA